jgi:hypothetical protein
MPGLGQDYYIFIPGFGSIKETWNGDCMDLVFREKGNVHPTKEAAEAWGAAQGDAK